MSKKQKRFGLIFGVFIAAAIGVSLVLTALNESITYFYTPSELAGIPPSSRPIRLGGLVMDGSVQHAQVPEAGGATRMVSFSITDGGATTTVSYAGILPDLFREGQGVIVQGRLGTDGVLVADTVLAKHDENYMPKEVADALKEQGRWKDEGDNAGY